MEFTALFNIENIITSLAMTLIQFCWQAVVIALTLKIMLFLCNKQALKLRYYAALSALVACVLIPVITFIGFLNGQDISASLASSEGLSVVQSGELIVSTNGNLFEDFWLSILQIVDIRVLVLLWAVGALSMVSKFALDLRDTYRLTRVGTSSVNNDIQQMVNKVSKHFGLSRSVQVLKSTLVNVPVVIGWLSPTVLLPVAITIGLDRKQLELIIAHELAHVQRLDFLVNLVQGFVQVVFFYHPCIYWVNKVLREEREYICDSMALSVFDNKPGKRLDLAKALLNIEELKEGNLSLVAVAASDGHLKNRIGRIVLNEKNRMASSKGILVSVFALVFSFTTIAVTSELSNSSNSLTFEPAVIHSELSNMSENVLSVPIAQVESTDNQQSDSLIALPANDYEGRANSEALILSPSNEKENEIEPPLTNAEKKLNSLGTNTILPKPQPLAKLQKEIKKQLSAKSQELVESPLVQTRHQTTLVKLPAEKKQVVKKVALLDATKPVEFTEPRAISTPYPVYPASAFSNKLSGKVRVDFIIDEEGRVIDAQFGEGTSWLFVKEIRSKFKEWRYEPAVKNGVKTAYNSSIYFDFELPNEEPLVRYQVGSRIRRNIR